MTNLQLLAFCLIAIPIVWGLYELCVAARMLFLLKRGARTVPAPPGLIGELIKQGQQRREKAQRRHHRLMQLLIAMRALGRALPDGLAVLDSETKLIWSNSQAEKLLRGDLPKRGMCLQFGDKHAQEWLTTGAFEPLLDFANAKHPELRLSLKMTPFLQQYRLLIARDVTVAMRLAQVRRDFVANVSHELRTPLTVINGYLDTFEPDELPEYSEVLEQMRNQSRRMVQIVADLLTLARLDHTTESPTGDVSLAPLLGHLLDDANGLSRGAHKISLVDNLPMDITGDEKDLRSAFSNLVSNAVRYTPAGGAIVLTWGWHADGAMFSVKDSGVGISEQHLPRLTERFYRISTSRSRESGGTGLGLAIVKHVLESHQGRLEIESVIGEGSTFKCILPRERLRYRESLV